MADGARRIFGGCQIAHEAENQIQALANATGTTVQVFKWYQMAAVPNYGPTVVRVPVPSN